jgi:hypothetical protein
MCFPANYSLEKFSKRLVGLGKTDVEDALQRLDMLTKEEIRLTAASSLKAIQDIAGNMEKREEFFQNAVASAEASEAARNVKEGALSFLSFFMRLSTNFRLFFYSHSERKPSTMAKSSKSFQKS